MIQPKHRPGCPRWCTEHDDQCDIHLGVVHTIELEQEERGIGLQVEGVLGDADDPGQPPLIHLQQSVGHDGVNVMPDEADALAALLPRLAERQATTST